MSQRRAVLFFNSKAGSRDTSRRERIEAVLGSELALDVVDVTSAGHLGEVVDRHLAEQTDIFIAAGGDGTVSSVASRLIGTNRLLGIIPCGTSNSTARALGIASDIEEACRTILQCHAKAIDAGSVNVGGVSHPLVLHAAIGFHADTIDTTTDENKAALGKLAYIVRGFERLGEFESFDVDIETDRGRAQTRAMSVTVANISPSDSIFAHGTSELVPNDGLLDLTIAAGESALEALGTGLELAVRAFGGSAANEEGVPDGSSPRVGWMRCAEVTLRANPPQRVLVDGDMIGTTPVAISVVPRGLLILVPKSGGPDDV